MYRLTTPTHIFHVPFDTNNIDKLRITYSQNEKVIVEKTENDATFGDKTISVALSQSETALFKSIPYTAFSNFIKIQLRVKIGKKVMASNYITIPINEVLCTEVL